MHLLHRSGREHYQVEIAVRASLAGLEIVALRGLYGAQSRASALAVDYKARQLACGQITHSLAHQADARARRRSHDALARGGSAVNHIDRRQFRFGLKDHHPRGLPRFELHEGLHNFGLRRNGVSEITVATATYGSMGDHLVAFHQSHLFFCHNYSNFCRYTTMQLSGQMIPHDAHPVHASRSTCTA